MEPGGEQQAREFYAGALGFTEVLKPEELRARGGCWFRNFEQGVAVAELHLGVEPGFTPPKKAHPALLVDDTAQLEQLAERIRAQGCTVDFTEHTSFEGFERFDALDPFGNRLEFLAAVPKPETQEPRP